MCKRQNCYLFRYFVIVLFLLVSSGNIMAQSKLVKGSVFDESKIPLTGVTVVQKGTTIGTVTDQKGNFSIQLTEKEPILRFSFIGMKNIEVQVGDQKEISLTMETEISGLDDVVVIGYGSRAKKDVTTAISVIDTKSIEKVVSMNPVMAMQGTMSGVQVSGNSGNLMDKPSIRIRGVNTWGIADPLYVVDGIPVQISGEGADAESGIGSWSAGPLNIMNMIDPNDIESISVLKDASAAAIYGVRAGNGVILITTKKGKGDKPRLEFSSRLGIQNMTQHLNMLNTAQYTKHIQDVYASNPSLNPNIYNVDVIDPNSAKYLGNSKTYDWQNEMKNKNAPMQEYSLRLLGGTAKTDYFMSLGYAEQEGSFQGNNLERYNMSFKVNSQVNSWLRAGINYRLSMNKGTDGPDYIDLNFVKLAQAPPWQPVYGNGPNGYQPVVTGYAGDGSWNNDPIWGAGTQWNFNGLMASNGYNFKGLRNMGNVYLELEPVKDLKIRGTVSVDYNSRFMQLFVNNKNAWLNPNFGDPGAEGGGSSAGYIDEATVSDFNLVKELTVNYKKSFGNHNFDLLLNTMHQNVESKVSGIFTYYVPTENPDLRTIINSDYVSAGTGIQRSALMGYMSRLSYNYNSKYYLDATVRYDGSTRFAPEYRWDYFPSVSAAWRISGESFMENNKWLSDLKLRAGWGQLGNQEVPNLQYMSPINGNPAYAWGLSTDGKGTVVQGATIFGIPTPNLLWEKTTTYNIGIDAVIKTNLSLSIEYYNKLTDGLIQTMTIPASVGATILPYANIGSVSNKGWEMSANYNNHAGDFVYSVSANFTTVKNTVEKTYNHIPMWNVEEGQSLFYIKGYKNDGIFQTQAEVDAWKAKYEDDSYQTPLVAPGDYHFQDLRSAPSKPGTFYKDSLDNRINSYDMVNLGNTIPKFSYGFNFNLQYKGFDVSAMFTGVGGVYKYNDLRASLEYSPTDKTNLSTAILNAWTPDNKNTSIPRVMGGDPASNFRTSDLYVEKAGYLRMSNLQLGYTLPQTVYNFTNHSISNIRLYGAVSNVFTITKYTGVDPENDYYPIPRIVSMGLNVSF